MMKPLAVMVSDLRDMANMLRDQADQLEELATFFGGPKQREVTRTQTEPEQIPSQSSPTPIKGKRGIDRNIRQLNKQEKDSIRKDWDSLPPHQRTKENRTALARKYQCSGVQVWGLTRDPSQLLAAAELSRKARAKGATQTSS